MNARIIHYLLQTTLFCWVACVCLFVAGVPTLRLAINTYLYGMPPSAITHFVLNNSSILALSLAALEVAAAIGLWRKRTDPLAMLSIAVALGFVTAMLLVVVMTGLISPLMNFSCW